MVNVQLNSPTDDVKTKSKQIHECLKGRAVVLIWATWCPHCTSMKPAWDKTKGNLSKQGISFVEIESVNVERLEPGLKQKVVASKHLYFPMIRMFRNSKSQEYSSERDSETMTKEIAKKLGTSPSVKAKKEATKKTNKST